ncbi:hypothetical protein PoB_001064300 [Plakobranchus ocellatus]|uniref:C2H2-type domain-containing protein n=1 Tax=Plakobranchus ocellatus TaxID=259542 RepID=A0AAV3YNK4_9GAST|nr:hypothetical protein PoB_001064300 [Plakobranchus ocellatus]
MKILYYNEHFMYIIDIDKLGCALACEKCGKLWKQQCSLDRHQKSCTGLGSRVRYYGGVYTAPSSIVEDLSRYGFGIDEDLFTPIELRLISRSFSIQLTSHRDPGKHSIKPDTSRSLLLLHPTWKASKNPCALLVKGNHPPSSKAW